jgi:hypothetical protein
VDLAEPGYEAAGYWLGCADLPSPLLEKSAKFHAKSGMMKL